MFPVSRSIDRFEATFDHDGLIANAGLIVLAPLMSRFGLERLANQWVRTGSFAPGRICTLIAAMLAGATHIDQVDVLRVGATQAVLPFKVMAPSTIGTFLRSFTFGFVRQLDAVASRLLANAWAAGAGPGDADLVIDLDSTICEVHGHAKQGAGYGYTKCLGYHPLVATRAGSGEILFSRMRKGSAGSSRGINRFVDELAGILKRAKATGATYVRADSGFWSWELLRTLDRHKMAWSRNSVNTNQSTPAPYASGSSLFPLLRSTAPDATPCACQPAGPGATTSPTCSKTCGHSLVRTIAPEPGLTQKRVSLGNPDQIVVEHRPIPNARRQHRRERPHPTSRTRTGRRQRQRAPSLDRPEPTTNDRSSRLRT